MASHVFIIVVVVTDTMTGLECRQDDFLPRAVGGWSWFRTLALSRTITPRQVPAYSPARCLLVLDIQPFLESLVENSC
jgi:hypothetical protein